MYYHLQGEARQRAKQDFEELQDRWKKIGPSQRHGIDRYRDPDTWLDYYSAVSVRAFDRRSDIDDQLSKCLCLLPQHIEIGEVSIVNDIIYVDGDAIGEYGHLLESFVAKILSRLFYRRQEALQPQEEKYEPIS